MATPKTITGKVTTPGGVALAGVPVAAVLSQQCTIPGTQEVVPANVTTTSASDGTFTLSLYANNDLTPNGTYYTVTEAAGGGGFLELTIQVPQTAGPFVLTNLTTSTPTASPTPNHVSTLIVDGATTLGIPLAVLGTATASIRAANVEIGGATTGTGSFDSGAGSFSGSGSGTLLAVNAVTGFAGRAFDFQTNGTSTLRGGAAGSALSVLHAFPTPTNAGGQQGVVIEAPTDPGGLTTFTQSLIVKASTLTFATGSNQRLVELQQPTYAATTPQTFAQVETLLVNGAPQPGANATFTQSVGAKIVGGLVIDGTGSVGSVGDPIALNVGSGFIVLSPQVTSPYGGDAGIGISPADGTGITHSTRTVGIKSNTMTVTSQYDQQMHVLIQPQTITSVAALAMDRPTTLWIQAAPIKAGSMTFTNARAINIASGDLGLDAGDIVLAGILRSTLSGTPTTNGLNAGLTSATVTGNDVCGFIDFVTNGTAPTANQKLCRFNFYSGSRYASTPVVQLTNGSQGANAGGALGTAAWVGEYGHQSAGTSFVDIYLNNGAMPNNATLRCHYLIIGSA